MASREKKRRIDTQWQTLQPSWDKKDYDGERKMLHDTLDDDENIERLSASGWKVLEGEQAMESHERGIVTATGRQVIFLNKGRITRNVAQIPYLGIREVKEQGPGNLTVVASRFDYSLTLDHGAAAWLISSGDICPRIQRPWRTGYPAFLWAENA